MAKLTKTQKKEFEAEYKKRWKGGHLQAASVLRSEIINEILAKAKAEKAKAKAAEKSKAKGSK
jgi:hypothetical protein